MIFLTYLKKSLENKSFYLFNDGNYMRDFTYVGDVVQTEYGLSKIKKIEIMPEPRHYSKCGINVKKMFTNLLEYCIIDLDNGHFVYGDQIEKS